MKTVSVMADLLRLRGDHPALSRGADVSSPVEIPPCALPNGCRFPADRLVHGPTAPGQSHLKFASSCGLRRGPAVNRQDAKAPRIVGIGRGWFRVGPPEP